MGDEGEFRKRPPSQDNGRVIMTTDIPGPQRHSCSGGGIPPRTRPTYNAGVSSNSVYSVM